MNNGLIVVNDTGVSDTGRSEGRVCLPLPPPQRNGRMCWLSSQKWPISRVKENQPDCESQELSLYRSGSVLGTVLGHSHKIHPARPAPVNRQIPASERGRRGLF